MVELFKHNLESYNKMKEVLSKDNKVLLVQATSTGKSFVTMKLLQEDYHELRKLYVVPKSAVKDNVMLYPEWSNYKTDFVTYNRLTRLNITRVVDSYDIFIFDEVHHAGADVWGAPVEYLINSGKLCIGLTATPVRPSDKVDVGEKLFKGNVVVGPDITKAIEEGLWSEFKYLLTVNNIRERLYAAKQKVDELPLTVDTIDIKTESGGIELDDAANYTVRNMVTSNLSFRCNKWLVFCSNRKQLETIDDDVYDWFDYDRVQILKVDSSSGSNKVKESITEFNDYSGETPMVLASVNILNEGLHLSGVTGIIMLRHTESPVIYMQQLGRAMTTNKGIKPVVIDVADNLSMLRRIVGSTSARTQSIQSDDDIGEMREKSTVILSKEVSITAEMLISMEEFIEKVKNINIDAIWTDDELYILRKFYPDVTGRLNKTKIAIRKKAIELGLAKVITWTPYEDEVLKGNYPVMGMKVRTLLTSKSDTDIRNRVRKFNLKYKGRWTYEEDVEVLKGGIPDGRTMTECIARRNKLRRGLS